MANFQYDPEKGHLVHRNGNHPQSNAHLTQFMVMREGKLVFEGTQRELEASTDSYVVKFVPKRP